MPEFQRQHQQDAAGQAQGAPAHVFAAIDTAQAWAVFAAAPNDAAFYGAWLALQCAAIEGARVGLLLMQESGTEAYVPAAMWPDPRLDLSRLKPAAERALAQRRGIVLTADDDLSAAQPLASDTVHVAYPLETDGALVGAVVLELRAMPPERLQAVMRQLLWGAGWLEAQQRRRELLRKSHLLTHASVALDLIAAVHEQDSLTQAAFAVVNEMATVAQADRVSLGLERGAQLKLCAISRTAWFDAKSQLVVALERAMEEAMDQAAWLAHPQPPDGPARITMAQRDLAVASGAAQVLTLPIMHGGLPIGALTLERDQGESFDAATIRLCEAVCAVLGGALRERIDGERWFAGRAARSATDLRAKLLGPSHQGLKFASGLALILALFLVFAEGQFRVSARTVVEGSVQRASVAPFDGFVAQALVRAGALVAKGDVLAVMDDRDLKLERARWDAEREQVARKYGEALAKRERAATGIISAQLNQAESQLALADEKLARTRLVAPFDAMVVSGDLSQMLGAPVEKGKVLFELAPLDQFRVVLRVDERDIGFITVGQKGELALVGISGETLPFVVKTVTSVATAQDGRNFFRVEAQLTEASKRLRPGMEGVGKIAVAERSLVWIWTRNFVNWVRLSFWSWMP